MKYSKILVLEEYSNGKKLEKSVNSYLKEPNWELIKIGNRGNFFYAILGVEAK